MVFLTMQPSKLARTRGLGPSEGGDYGYRVNVLKVKSESLNHLLQRSLLYFKCSFRASSIRTEPQPPELAASQVVTTTRWGYTFPLSTTWFGFRYRRCLIKLFSSNISVTD